MDECIYKIRVAFESFCENKKKELKEDENQVEGTDE